MPAINKGKILVGRKAVEAYREAHHQLYLEPWHRGIPEEHTPLLQALVNALEGLGFTSSETDFEPKKTEILAKLWTDSDELNIQELGLEGKKLIEADMEALDRMWH